MSFECLIVKCKIKEMKKKSKKSGVNWCLEVTEYEKMICEFNKKIHIISIQASGSQKLYYVHIENFPCVDPEQASEE